MTDRDLRRDFANLADTTIAHPLVQEVITELLGNLSATPTGLPAYGIRKVANAVAQVSRAQTLGIDPQVLIMDADEANEELAKFVCGVAEDGQPVWVVTP